MPQRPSHPLRTGVAALLATGHALLPLVAVASIGNILGSCVTYAMGRGAEQRRIRRWFPLPPDTLAKAQGWWGRWGLWSLLLSWAPGGDALVALAGLMRVPLWRFLLLVALAKTRRYAALALAACNSWSEVARPAAIRRPACPAAAPGEQSPCAGHCGCATGTPARHLPRGETSCRPATGGRGRSVARRGEDG